MTGELLKLFIPSILTFTIGILITPIVTHYLYKYKLWKKSSVKLTTDGQVAELTNKLHNDESKKTPRMGGVVVWGSVFLTTGLLALLYVLFPNETTEGLQFFSREQTWIPLSVMLVAALIGLTDDLSVVKMFGNATGGGLSLKIRLGAIALIGALVGYWLYSKLDLTGLYLPFVGMINVGVLIIPIIIVFMVGIFSGGVIDGIDGLSGGVLASAFLGFAAIAGYQAQFDIAALCMAIVGGILAFLWFNIPPARFYMSETGMMALTTTLCVVAVLTNSLLVLPIIAFPLVLAAGSSTLQLIWKKVFKKKLFLVAPIHHHFEALGWPPYKVVMRFWIVGVFSATLGVVIHILG